MIRRKQQKQNVTKRSAKEVAQGKAHFKIAGGKPKPTEAVAGSKTAGPTKAVAGSKTAGPTKGKGQTFAQAFAAARKEKGAGKTFTWNGKKYSTNRADDRKKTTTVASKSTTKKPYKNKWSESVM